MYISSGSKAIGTFLPIRDFSLAFILPMVIQSFPQKLGYKKKKKVKGTSLKNFKYRPSFFLSLNKNSY